MSYQSGNDPWAAEPTTPSGQQPVWAPPGWSQQQHWTPPPDWGQPPPPPGMEDPLVSWDYAGWWQRGAAIIKRGWKHLLILQAIGIVPMAALGVAAIFLLLPQLRAIEESSRATRYGGQPAFPADAFFTFFGAVLVLVLILSVVQQIVDLAVARTAVTVALGGTPSIGAAVREAATRVPAMIGRSLLSAPILLVGLAFCVLPGLYVYAALAILPSVVLFERGAGIGRCFQLFNNSFGPALGRVATMGGIYFAISAGLQLVQGLTTSITGSPGQVDVVDIAATVAVYLVLFLVNGFLIMPLGVLTYADLRARHESFTGAQLA